MLFRLFLILLIGILLGGSLYFGASYLAKQYFQAVQDNTENVDLLTKRLDQMEVQINTRIDELTSRLDTITLLNDEFKLTVSDIEGSVTDMETLSEEAITRIQTLEASAAEMESSVSAQSTEISVLKTQAAQIAADLPVAQAELDDLKTQVNQMTDLLDGWDLTVSNYGSTLHQIKALVLLSRAQLSISQNNFGLAQQDVQTARDAIALLENNTGTHPPAAYAAILVRLDSALLNLPDSPIAANTDIESAWNTLWALIETDLQAEPTSTQTPEPTPES